MCSRPEAVDIGSLVDAEKIRPNTKLTGKLFMKIYIEIRFIINQLPNQGDEVILPLEDRFVIK